MAYKRVPESPAFFFPYHRSTLEQSEVKEFQEQTISKATETQGYLESVASKQRTRMCHRIKILCPGCYSQSKEWLLCEVDSRPYQRPCKDIIKVDRVVRCLWCERFDFDGTNKDMVLCAAVQIKLGPGLPLREGMCETPVEGSPK